MTGDAAPSTRTGVVVPIRSFTGAKERLASHLDAPARAAALRSMAGRVLDAAFPMPVVVVSSAPEVRGWAAARGAGMIDDPGSLDLAAAAGVQHLAARGLECAVVAHADLPLAQALAPVADGADHPTVTLVPCHRDDGTNVISLPSALPFRFAYGPGSFRRHLQEARRLGMAARVLRLPDLVVDVDTADDLRYLRSSCTAP